jgi:GAF domain-containing protein
VFTYDGELIHLVAYVNVHADYIQFLSPAIPDAAGREDGRRTRDRTCSVCTIEDVLADPDYGIAGASATGGFRSILAVPLLSRWRAIGGIAVGRPEPGPFPQSQVALLQTFADQAVIAIENVRLFTELEALQPRQLHALRRGSYAPSATLARR